MGDPEFVINPNFKIQIPNQIKNPNDQIFLDFELVA